MNSKVIYFSLSSVFFQFIIGQESCHSTLLTWEKETIECSEDDYKLVFYDEFDGESLDTNKWYTYYPYGKNGSDSCEYCRTHGDRERQVYKDSNVVLNNGILSLILKKEKAKWYDAQREHTSGMIQTKQKFKYGKFEIRCKIPKGNYFWPAFWLWGGDECDVFEFCGDNTYKFNSNLHMDYKSKHYQVPKPHYLEIDYSTDFHTFSVEWERLYTSWYVDGQLVRKIPYLKTIVGNSVDCGDRLNIQTVVANRIIPDAYMSVIANFAMSRDIGYCKNEASDNQPIFPASFDIDYIRVYQKDIQKG